MTNQLEAQFYFSGVIDYDGECQQVSDEEAQFWTVYERNANGLSSAICDCYHRDDAVAATERFNALIVALEQSQERVYKLENDEVRQRLANAEHRLYMSELAKRNLRISRRTQLHKRRAAERRVAELESSQLAVKLTSAASDVLAERERQVNIEGWMAQGDDTYEKGELADAAACYAAHSHAQGLPAPLSWPWDRDWWKQTDTRRDLVKAGALILAEIERIDRAAGGTVQGD